MGPHSTRVNNRMINSRKLNDINFHVRDKSSEQLLVQSDNDVSLSYAVKSFSSITMSFVHIRIIANSFVSTMFVTGFVRLINSLVRQSIGRVFIVSYWNWIFKGSDPIPWKCNRSIRQSRRTTQKNMMSNTSRHTCRTRTTSSNWTTRRSWRF